MANAQVDRPMAIWPVASSRAKMDQVMPRLLSAKACTWRGWAAARRLRTVREAPNEPVSRLPVRRPWPTYSGSLSGHFRTTQASQHGADTVSSARFLDEGGSEEVPRFGR